MKNSTPSSTSARRPYRSVRREEQARATREAIAEAARAMFLERGWDRTRVRDVAEAAGVAEPTVYATYGNKAGLALALLDAVDSTADVDRVRADMQTHAGEPADQIAAMVAFERRLFEHAGDVVALLRDGGQSTPELAAAYAAGIERGDTARREIFGSWSNGTLRHGVDTGAAVDIFAALCNIDVWRVLTAVRGWSPERVESWWRQSLVQLLLAGASDL